MEVVRCYYIVIDSTDSFIAVDSMVRVAWRSSRGFMKSLGAILIDVERWYELTRVAERHWEEDEIPDGSWNWEMGLGEWQHVMPQVDRSTRIHGRS